jgi:translation initiation factor 3 subunit I
LVYFSPIGSKATVAAFAPLGREIITGHESGKVALFDAETGEEIEINEKAHLGQVTDLQLSPDGTYFVTSSKDQTAKVSERAGFAPPQAPRAPS